MKRVKLLAAGMLVLGQALSGAASAAPVTLFGGTVDFTFDDALLDLFGAASVSGNTLYFTPTAFDAQSLNGGGFALANETINVKLTAHTGYEFTTLALAERGDYLLLGSGSTVDVGGQIRAFDVAAQATDATSSIVASTPMNLAGMPTHNWAASASLNVADMDARMLNVTVENLLLAATSSPTSLAFIEKKYAGLTVGTVAVTPVPEAETYGMMLAGLGLIGWMARRRGA